MTLLLDWRIVNDADSIISYAHRVHQRKLHVEKQAIETRRKLHRDRRFSPPRKYSGNFY